MRYEPEGREAVIDHLNELVEMLKKHFPFWPMKEINVGALRASI